MKNSTIIIIFPAAIWKAEPAVMKHYLRKWLKNQGLDGDDFDLRNILDWDYYKNRLEKTIQKIITILAALQKISNPVPRTPHPNWLQQTVRRLNDRYQQRSITSMFNVIDNNTKTNKITDGDMMDIEDIAGKGNSSVGRPIVHSRKRNGKKSIISNKNILNTEVSDEDKNNINETKIQEKVKLISDTFQQWLQRGEKYGILGLNGKGIPTISNQTPGKMYLIIDKPKKTRKAMGSMEGYIRDATQALSEKDWHIVEVREIFGSDKGIGSTSSGEFVVWVMVGKASSQKISMTVPRAFYINCRQEILQRNDEDFVVKKVDRHLPYV